MRTLVLIAMFVGSVASASGTVVNIELAPEPLPDLKIQPSPRLRLVQIDQELRSLEHRVSASEVFVQKMNAQTPFLALGAIPIAAVGVVYGALFKTGIGSSSSSDPLFGILAGGAAAIAAGVAVITVLVSSFAVVDHLVAEASTACDREARARNLRSERQELNSRI